jgi:quercetin dioxygenase-like cupin family protein
LIPVETEQKARRRLIMLSAGRRSAQVAKRRTTVEIKRSGSQPSGKGPADWFTGTVRIDPLFSPPDPARVGGASVTFEPGARTAWHTHPLGQTLIVTAGCGWVQREGGPVEEIRPGDVGLVFTGRETLARSHGYNGDDSYRNSGKARWQGCRLDGTGQ